MILSMLNRSGFVWVNHWLTTMMMCLILNLQLKFLLWLRFHSSSSGLFLCLYGAGSYVWLQGSFSIGRNIWLIFTRFLRLVPFEFDFCRLLFFFFDSVHVTRLAFLINRELQRWKYLDEHLDGTKCCLNFCMRRDSHL